MAASYSDAQETQQDTTHTSIFSVVEVLDEAVATAEKSRVVYRLDRQKVSGNANLSASGGTAVDVLKSIPSVQVNADGELSYRGSTGFLVYVDGRQSVLEGTQALQQISAANIEDVEIITTPSARYKTDGDVGIINIITRKQDEAGFSGSVNASGSTIGSWNGDALMNLRKGSNRWYLGLTAAQQKGRSDFLQDRKAVVDEYVTESLSDGERFSCNSSYIARIGYELNLRSHRILFEAQTGVTEVARGGDLKYDEYRTFADQLINDALYDSKDRYSNEKRLAQLSADYDWKINDRGDNLSFRSRFRYDWYALEYTESNMFDEAGARYEGTRGYEDEAHWDIDVALAYDLHYRKSGKAEFGYQMTSYSEFGDYSIKYWNREVKDFQWQDHLAAPFWYRRQLHSLYAMVTDKFGPVSLEAGVRGEHTNDKMHFEHTYTSRDIKRWILSCKVCSNIFLIFIYIIFKKLLKNRAFCPDFVPASAERFSLSALYICQNFKQFWFVNTVYISTPPIDFFNGLKLLGACSTTNQNQICSLGNAAIYVCSILFQHLGKLFPIRIGVEHPSNNNLLIIEDCVSILTVLQILLLHI